MPASHKIEIKSVVRLSPRKLEALNGLSIPGIKLSDGYGYVLREYASPDTTLDDARRRLSSIKTSLANSGSCHLPGKFLPKIFDRRFKPLLDGNLRLPAQLQFRQADGRLPLGRII